jgi:hypothetical protein
LDFKLRFNVFSGLSIQINDNPWSFEVAHGSLTAEIVHHLALEAGGGLSTSFFGGGGDLFARAGWITDLYRGRPRGMAGWVIQFSALGGYRFLSLIATGDGYEGIEKNHCLQLLLRLESTYWFGPHFGLNIALASGASLSLFASHNSEWSDVYVDKERTWFLGDFSLAFGLAF